MTARPGDMLAHYRLAEKIGEGGMGVVYKALDTRLGRPVALKFLPEAFARDPERLARFEREARLLAALDDPRIAAIHGFEEADGVRFLVMELVAGETLAGRLARAPLPVREALAVCLPIACALEAARLTLAPGLSEWPAWSPDGTLLAFASNRSGNFEIYVRRIEGGQEVNVTNDPADDVQPAFSPDGTSIAFISTRSSRTGLIRIGGVVANETFTIGGDLWVIPALGGQARRLASDANFPAWHPGGRTIAFVSGQEESRSLLEVSTDGGAPRALLPSESSSWGITRLQYSPAGDWITFEAPSSQILAMPASGGPPRKLIAASSHVWDPGGRRLYFLSRESGGGTSLQALDIDEARAEIRGAPVLINPFTGTLRDLAISRDGRHLAVSGLEGSLILTRLPLAPSGDAPSGPEELLSEGSFNDRTPGFSPDGRRIAFMSNRLGTDEIWVLDIDSRRLDPLRLPGKQVGVSFPSWFPDGRQLTVSRLLEDGTFSLWIAAVDGSHTEEIVKMGRAPGGGLVSPDGRSVAYGARREESEQIYMSDLATRKERQITKFPGATFLEAWSPDGRWIAFVSSTDGTMQLWRVPASGGEAERLTTGEERMRHASYSPDGRWIYIQPSHGNIHRLPASGGPLRQVTRFPESGLFIEEPTLSPDGRYLAYCRWRGGASLWLLTLAEGHEGTPQ